MVNEEIAPKIFKCKPYIPAGSYGRNPYGAISRCAFYFSENAQELTDGMRLLRQGFLNALSTHGFRKLSFAVFRYRMVKETLI